MRISQHPRQRYLPRFDPAAAFARWLGRTLTRHENEVITALEARRFHNFPSPRILIFDPWYESSVPVLAKYLRYLDSLRPEYRLRSLIVDRTPDEAVRFAVSSGTDCIHASCNNAHRKRGHNYQRLILLNIQDYGSRSPMRRDNYRWQKMYANIVSPVNIQSHNLVIIHCRLPQHWTDQQTTRVTISATLPRNISSQFEIHSETIRFRHIIRQKNHEQNTSVETDIIWPVLSPPGDPPSTINHPLTTINTPSSIPI